MDRLSISNLASFYHGKVRDVYFLNNELLVMIASDRISAFDVILPKPIPFKGQILNQIAAFMLKLTSEVCDNWLLDVPAPNVSVGRNCTPVKLEMVIRGNLSGHAWRTYQSGKRILCGVSLPEGLKENDFLPAPIITPSTKASEGHDEDISREEILSRKIISESDYQLLEQYTHALFEKGKSFAATRGLILADTKYEFGKYKDKFLLIDEVHTPDSSRYFYAEGFEENQKKGLKQKQLSKEFVREWLVENNFMGREGQQVPEMTDERVSFIYQRYVELYETLLGETFNPESLDDEVLLSRINQSIKKFS